MGKKIGAIIVAMFVLLTSGNSQTFLDSAINIFKTPRLHLLSKLRKDPPYTIAHIPYKWCDKDFGLSVYFGVFPDVMEVYRDPNDIYDVQTFYVINDTIIAAEFTREDFKTMATISSRSPHVLFQYSDSIRLEKYLDKHNKYFLSSFTIHDFLGARPYLQYPGYHYGKPSGYRDSSMKKICNMVKARDRNMLQKLASSLFGVDRVYGILGLLFLQKEGIVLTSEEERLINANRLSNEIVFVVYIDGELQRKKISELFGDLFFQYGYDLMKARNDL